MDEHRARQLLSAARVARFATVTPEGRPRIVPVCFAAAGGVIYHAVDHKPKSSRLLARLADIAQEPRASLLADHYDDDAGRRFGGCAQTAAPGCWGTSRTTKPHGLCACWPSATPSIVSDHPQAR